MARGEILRDSIESSSSSARPGLVAEYAVRTLSCSAHGVLGRIASAGLPTNPNDEVEHVARVERSESVTKQRQRALEKAAASGFGGLLRGYER